MNLQYPVSEGSGQEDGADLFPHVRPCGPKGIMEKALVIAALIGLGLALRPTNTTAADLRNTAGHRLFSRGEGGEKGKDISHSPYAEGSLSNLRPWTTEDSIPVRYFGLDVLDWIGNTLSPIATASADGRYFFVASGHQELDGDWSVQTLQVYDAARVKRWLTSGERKPPPPFRSLDFRTHSTSGAALFEPRWSDHGYDIYLIGKDSRDHDQIFQVDVKDGSVHALTDDPYQKLALNFRGDGLIYWRGIPPEPRADVPYPITWAPRNASGDIQFEVTGTSVKSEWIASFRGGEAWRLPIPPGADVTVWMSPDGRRAVLRTSVESEKSRLILANLEKREIEPLSPSMSDGSVPDPSMTIEWSPDGLTPSLANKANQHDARPPNTLGALSVNIRQSANDPPQLLVSYENHERVLSSRDPALDGLRIAQEHQFVWSTVGGQKMSGGLTLPRGTGPARVPLVIEAAYDYTPTVFLPDGAWSSGYAHQALVSNGIAVLEMDVHAFPDLAPGREGPAFVEAIDSAIETLTKQGVINSERVAAIGFSRAGFEVYYAVTHPGRTALAAAEVTDAGTLSLPEMLGVVGISGERMAPIYSGANGGKFWEHKSDWVKHDVLMNADRAEAPTLFSYHGRSARADDPFRYFSVMVAASLQLNHRPFDYLFIPTGSHALLLPRQRYASMEATVDWMNFWLQGREDAIAEKAEQYLRWREIRRKNDERLSSEAKFPAKPKTHFAEIDESTGKLYIPPVPTH